MSYEIEADNFKGPIGKLLEFIENKKYEINKINLAKITGDFLNYLTALENKDSRVLADFISVAAKLILIKSKSLIPDLTLTEEEEKSIEDLEHRLKIYKEFKLAEDNLNVLWNKKNISFSRPFFPPKISSGFIPSSQITADSLLKTIQAIKFSAVSLKTNYEKYEMIDFEKYVSELILRINQNISEFASISKDKNKKEIVILFLAILHLLKDNKISITQNSSFSEIIITPNHYA